MYYEMYKTTKFLGLYQTRQTTTYKHIKGTRRKQINLLQSKFNMQVLWLIVVVVVVIFGSAKFIIRDISTKQAQNDYGRLDTSRNIIPVAFFSILFLVYHKKITKTITTLQKKYAIVHQSCTLCFKTQGKNNHKKTCFYTLVTDQVHKKNSMVSIRPLILH